MHKNDFPAQVSAACKRGKNDTSQSPKRLIAIGGGSTIDLAKMLSLITPSGKTEDLFLGLDAPTRIYSVYAVPTTCGTGSEVTSACAAELTNLHTKRGFSSMLMFPDKAVLIPELVSDLPYQFFATSSMDALIHAAESFLSPDASPVSELFSREAIRLILNGYQRIVNIGPEQWTNWTSDFLNASNFAGLAFSSAGCAAVHALSYRLAAAIIFRTERRISWFLRRLSASIRKSSPRAECRNLRRCGADCFMYRKARLWRPHSRCLTGYSLAGSCARSEFRRTSCAALPKASCPNRHAS